MKKAILIISFCCMFGLTVFNTYKVLSVKEIESTYSLPTDDSSIINEVNDLKNKNDDLTNELNTLKTNYETLVSEYENLKNSISTDNTKIKNDIQSINNNISSINKSDNTEELKNKITKLEQFNKDLMDCMGPLGTSSGQTVLLFSNLTVQGKLYTINRDKCKNLYINHPELVYKNIN